MASIPHLVEMEKKYGGKGFHVVGISPEAPEAVDKFLKSARGKIINYFVGVSEEGVEQLDVDGYPTLFMIDPEGKILSVDEMPTDQQLAAWLGGGVEHVAIEHEVDAAVKPAVELYNRQEYANAVAAAKKILSDPNLGEVAKIDAESLIDLVNEMAKKTEKLIDEYKQEGEYGKLSRLLTDIQKRMKGLDIASKAKTEEEGLKNPKVKAEMQALKELQSLLAALDKAKADADDAREALKKFVEKNKDSEAARRAEEALRK